MSAVICFSSNSDACGSSRVIDRRLLTSEHFVDRHDEARQGGDVGGLTTL